MAIGQMRRGSEDYNRRKNIITRALGIGRKWSRISLRWIWREGDYILFVPMVSRNMLGGPSPCMKSSQEREALRKSAALLIEEANRQGRH